jgi:hypothetical protein
MMSFFSSDLVVKWFVQDRMVVPPKNRPEDLLPGKDFPFRKQRKKQAEKE